MSKLITVVFFWAYCLPVCVAAESEAPCLSWLEPASAVDQLDVARQQLIDRNIASADAMLSALERDAVCLRGPLEGAYIARMFFLRAFITWKINDLDAASAYLQDAVAIVPDLQWDSELGEARDVRSFLGLLDDSRRERLHRQEQGGIQILDIGKARCVYINGREYLPGDAAYPLNPGHHLVQRNHPKKGWQSIWIEVTPRSTTKLERSHWPDSPMVAKNRPSKSVASTAATTKTPNGNTTVATGRRATDPLKSDGASEPSDSALPPPRLPPPGESGHANNAGHRSPQGLLRLTAFRIQPLFPERVGSAYQATLGPALALQHRAKPHIRLDAEIGIQPIGWLASESNSVEPTLEDFLVESVAFDSQGAFAMNNRQGRIGLGVFTTPPVGRHALLAVGVRVQAVAAGKGVGEMRAGGIDEAGAITGPWLGLVAGPEVQLERRWDTQKSFGFVNIVVGAASGRGWIRGQSPEGSRGLEPVFGIETWVEALTLGLGGGLSF